MYVLYVDESGKSGLKDPAQPYYALGGVVVKHEDWRAIETYFEKQLHAIVPRESRAPGWELHMVDLEQGKGFFKKSPRRVRVQLCDAVLDVVDKFDLTILAMAIDKKTLQTKPSWKKKPPDAWAYEFMVERFQHLLRRQQELGIVVGDEQKGAEALSRIDHATWRRSGTSALSQVDRIIETVFFLPSHHSLMIQIADGVAYWCNRAVKASKAKKAQPAQWARLRPHVDTLENGKVVGYKVWPP